MAERYTRLFALTENLYQSASPVMIAAGALLKDTQTGRVLAQLKLQSLSDKPIKAAKVDITPLDVVGNELGEAVEHQYLDLNIHRDEAFGAKSPVALPDATTRAFRAAVTSVVFTDNSVWEASSAAWEPLPKAVTLAEAYPDAELRKQFKLEFGAKSQYAYAEFADLCRCPCDALNRQDEAKCHVCGCNLLALRGLDITELEKRKDERLEQERIEREERLERERVEKEKAAVEADVRAKKIRKIAKFVVPITVVVIAFLVVLTKVIIPNGKYNDAVALMEAGEYDEAIAAFEAMDGYKDSAEKMDECRYSNAIELMEAGRDTEAATIFEALGDYRDARERRLTIRMNDAKQTVIAAGMAHTVALKSDGTVVGAGWNDDGQCDVGAWTDIVAVAAGWRHTVGLKSDGTVVAVGWNENGQCDVENWTDVVAIAAGRMYTVGLKSDGSAVWTNGNSGWPDATSFALGWSHQVFLKSDGTVMAVGESDYGQCDVEAWTDIVAVAAGRFHTIGLKLDGTVVATEVRIPRNVADIIGIADRGKSDVGNWTDIVAIAAGDNFSVGLKSDGTVVANGDNYQGSMVSGWRDIVAVCAALSGDTIIGLKSDGTVVAVGDNDYGQCDVSDWTDIKLPE